MIYAEQLKDPRWQKKRLEVLQGADFKCQECGEDKNTLHVHHRYYVSHRLAWEYPPFCYQVLCAKCHEWKKITTENRRDDELCMFEDWEAGLDYFGDDLFDMYMTSACAEDFKKAHTQ